MSVVFTSSFPLLSLIALCFGCHFLLMLMLMLMSLRAPRTLLESCEVAALFHGRVSPRTSPCFRLFGASSSLLCKRFTCTAPMPSQFCLSVRLSDIRVDQSKTVQAKITKSSPLAARKTLVLGSVKLFHKFERGHLQRGR